LGAAVAGLNDSQLDTPYGPGKWTVRQVVHHVFDSHLSGYARMRMALTEDTPTFKTYDQDAWAGLPDVASLPVTVSLSGLRALHFRWSEMLRRLAEDDWNRRGHHPIDGPRSVADLLWDYADHGRRHIGHITGLRRQKGW
jgi:hypothetical protein